MTLRSPAEIKLKKQIHHVLRNWHKADNHLEFPFDDPLLTHKEHSEIRSLINECLCKLSENDEQGALILRERFIQGNTILAVAHKLNLSPDQLNRRQRNAIEKLTEIVINWQQMMRETRSIYFYSHLQTPCYTRLVGFKGYIQSLKRALSQPHSPWIIEITGIGGIGKTALADAVTREVLNQFVFEDVTWLRAPFTEKGRHRTSKNHLDMVHHLAEAMLPPDTPPQDKPILLRQLLKSQPYLIVVDNLQTETEFRKVVKQLRNLLNPSKLLITSRYRTDQASDTMIFNLSELSVEDSRELLAHHAKQIGLGDQYREISKHMQSIYNVIGGNPMALKLLIGLLVTLPLSVVLEDFTLAKLDDIERMYRFIYWKAWHALDEPAQQLLMCMVEASDYGVTFESIQAISGLSKKTLAAALQALYNRSLVEPRGTIEERRYGIHRLTLSFIQTDIVP